MTFAPSDYPPDASVSDVTQSDASSTSYIKRRRVKFIETIIDEKTRPDASAKTNIRLPLPCGQYVFNAQFEDGPHNTAPPSHKTTYVV